MSYYAMVLPAHTGHVNPMAALGRALARRGHRIAFLAPLDAEAHATKAGLEFIPLATVEFPKGEWESTTQQMGRLSGMKACRCATRCLGRFARGILRDLPEIISKQRLDGIVMDQIAIGTDAVCEAVGMPLAVACNSLLLQAEPLIPPMLFSWEYRASIAAGVRNLFGYAIQNSAGWPVLKEVLPYRRRHRLKFMMYNHINHMPPSLVQVTQLPAFLDFPRRCMPRNLFYTGPWTDADAREERSFPWERLDGRPLIYASLGTLQNRLEHIFSMIAEACSGLRAQLVLAHGRKDLTAPVPLKSGALVVGYAPQLALLKRASLVITHGGLNTTLEALAEGVPLVLLPITNDQPGVAARVQRLGAGEVIPINRVTIERLRHALKSVFLSENYRGAARKCAEKIRHVDGSAQAAELIEKAFTTRQPVYGGA